ncbi:hypothetical protein RN001_011290 [Aquatica leii]|uniref:Protein cereblon n=1 Tax=Aquatica leii TaxID=1421715 RepID=A0AAN7P7U9_9COLE|nr:hypothetical protein RN001_011290 [Aquatica leii]
MTDPFDDSFEDRLENIIADVIEVVRHRDSDDSSNESTPEEPRENVEVFDTNLPTTHKYLGKLNNVSGYTIFDEGEIISLLAIHTNTLVFPGFTLPLVMNSQIEQSIMQNFLTKQNVFVLVCADEVGARLYKYGVTMEVFESFSQHGTLYLKAKGRQRCKIVPGKEIQHLGGRLQQITVKILAEPEITSPIATTQLTALKLHRSYLFKDYDSLIRNYKHRKYHLAQFTNPGWVYDRRELCFYVKFIVQRLINFYLKENIPTDPVSLSYWFIQNFQLAHEERLQLMKLDSVIERLRLELKFLEMERLLCCAVCKAEITNQKYVFAMSKDGVQSNYCNPSGHVYETVTVLKADNFNLTGAPSKEFSWFPGYWWTIMQCRLCRGHIGWKFSSNHLHPSAFYGLAKSGLDIKIVDKNQTGNMI